MMAKKTAPRIEPAGSRMRIKPDRILNLVEPGVPVRRRPTPKEARWMLDTLNGILAAAPPEEK